MSLTLFVMLKDTKVYSKGQKVWALWSTGALAAPVTGRYKKHGRWVDSWVHWADPHDPKGRSFSGMPDARYVARITDHKFEEFIESRSWAGRRLRSSKSTRLRGRTPGGSPAQGLLTK